MKKTIYVELYIRDHEVFTRDEAKRIALREIINGGDAGFSGWLNTHWSASEIWDLGPEDRELVLDDFRAEVIGEYICENFYHDAVKVEVDT